MTVHVDRPTLRPLTVRQAAAVYGGLVASDASLAAGVAGAGAVHVDAHGSPLAIALGLVPADACYCATAAEVHALLVAVRLARAVGTTRTLCTDATSVVTALHATEHGYAHSAVSVECASGSWHELLRELADGEWTVLHTRPYGPADRAARVARQAVNTWPAAHCTSLHAGRTCRVCAYRSPLSSGWVL